MGKKKEKKKKEDGGKEKDALPPPPNFDAERQGAVEALLSFKYVVVHTSSLLVG